jgi:hypothetical protein
VRKKPISALVLGGAAVHRCDNSSVLTGGFQPLRSHFVTEDTFPAAPAGHDPQAIVAPFRRCPSTASNFAKPKETPRKLDTRV